MYQEQVRRNCEAFLKVKMSLEVNQFRDFSISSLSVKFQGKGKADMPFPTELKFQHYEYQICRINAGGVF